VITLDESLTYQQIDGWEAVSNPMEPLNVRDSLLPHVDTLISIAVNDVGISRLRYSYKSGIEDTVDYFTPLINGEITYDEYKLQRYSKINDNDDPFVFNPEGFKTVGFQDNLDNLVVPFKTAVEANGEDFYFNLCFVDFANQSDFHHTSDPEEYAEFMSYPFYLMDSLYGFVPDGLEIILEPDNADIWNPVHVPPSLAAVGNRLSNMGYDPEYIAPSLKSLLGIPNWFDDIAANSVALNYLDVISYHRYGGNTNLQAQQELVDLADQYDKKLSMLEYDNNGSVINLHYDLKYNNNTAWTKYALMYKSDERFAYVYVDGSDSLNPSYGICKQTKYLRQYFKFIRPGAIRFEASTSNDQVDPIAFKNVSGNQVVVIKAEEGDSIVINGLQADEYGIKYTLGNFQWANVNPTQYDVDLENQIVNEGESLGFLLPNKGVVTVYGLNSSPVHVEETLSDNKPLQIFPNPASNAIQIEHIDRESLQYEITTIGGKRVLQGILPIGLNSIDISGIARGVYLIKVNDQSQKFVKL